MDDPEGERGSAGFFEDQHRLEAGKVMCSCKIGLATRHYPVLSVWPRKWPDWLERGHGTRDWQDSADAVNECSSINELGRVRVTTACHWR